MLRGDFVAQEDDVAVGGRSVADVEAHVPESGCGHPAVIRDTSASESAVQHLQIATIKRIPVVPIWDLFDSCHLPHAVGLLPRRIL
jgi:hypothetical protein